MSVKQNVLRSVYEKKMVSKYHIALNGEDIEQVDNIKFLGVCIDCKLTWNYHVQFLRKKIYQKLWVFYIKPKHG